MGWTWAPSHLRKTRAGGKSKIVFDVPFHSSLFLRRWINTVSLVNLRWETLGPTVGFRHGDGAWSNWMEDWIRSTGTASPRCSWNRTTRSLSLSAFFFVQHPIDLNRSVIFWHVLKYYFAVLLVRLGRFPISVTSKVGRAGHMYATNLFAQAFDYLSFSILWLFDVYALFLLFFHELSGGHDKWFFHYGSAESF